MRHRRRRRPRSRPRRASPGRRPRTWGALARGVRAAIDANTIPRLRLASRLASEPDATFQRGPGSLAPAAAAGRRRSRRAGRFRPASAELGQQVRDRGVVGASTIACFRYASAVVSSPSVAGQTTGHPPPAPALGSAGRCFLRCERRRRGRRRRRPAPGWSWRRWDRAPARAARPRAPRGAAQREQHARAVVHPSDELGACSRCGSSGSRATPGGRAAPPRCRPRAAPPGSPAPSPAPARGRVREAWCSPSSSSPPRRSGPARRRRARQGPSCTPSMTPPVHVQQLAVRAVHLARA